MKRIEEKAISVSKNYASAIKNGTLNITYNSKYDEWIIKCKKWKAFPNKSGGRFNTEGVLIIVGDVFKISSSTPNFKDYMKENLR